MDLKKINKFGDRIRTIDSRIRPNDVGVWLERTSCAATTNVDDLSENRFARTKASTKSEPEKPTCAKPGRKEKKLGEH